MKSEHQAILAAALDYAAHGWPVFPCHPETKRPLLKGDIDPDTGTEVAGTGGLKKASADLKCIRDWWARWPRALIGAPTGTSIGAFVVDFDAGVDADSGEVFEAEELVAKLCAEVGSPLPETWTVKTPRGGRHLYFRLPKEGPPPGNRTGLISRVDVRGEGGYVVVPPSVRADGKPYRWLRAPW
jgi:putative DNA primase/helicase